MPDTRTMTQIRRDVIARETAQHTLGKWVFRADDMMIVRLSPTGGLLDNLHIAEIKRQGPETEANARLIAAAPETAAERDRLKAEKAELVEALERLEDYTSRATNDLNDQDTGWYYQLIAATQKARAAIAKANS